MSRYADELDQRVWLALGRAVARAQVLETAMVKFLEAQRQDLTLPLDDRWDEISTWLGKTAGQLRTLLGVPDVVATDWSTRLADATAWPTIHGCSTALDRIGRRRQTRGHRGLTPNG